MNRDWNPAATKRLAERLLGYSGPPLSHHAPNECTASSNPPPSARSLYRCLLRNIRSHSNLSSAPQRAESTYCSPHDPVSLQSSGLRPFDTVLETRAFRVAYELQRKGVRECPSDWRELRNRIRARRLKKHASLITGVIHARRANGWKTSRKYPSILVRRLADNDIPLEGAAT